MVFIMQIYVDHVFISDRRRAVIGPICRYSDQLPISIRYGHADWDCALCDDLLSGSQDDYLQVTKSKLP